jgi:hypothetical protein
MEENWREILDETLEKLEAIGFFAAVGIHFAESAPILSEELGRFVKGTPWERLSTTDQCFKRIHQLASEVWDSLEDLRAWEKPAACAENEEGVQAGEPEEPPRANHQVNQRFAAVAQEMDRIRTMGEAIGSLVTEQADESRLDHLRVKALGEMILSGAKSVGENLETQVMGEDPTGGQLQQTIALIAEDVNRIQALGSSLVAMGMAFHFGYKLNPRQTESMGRLIVDLSNLVMEKMTQIDYPAPPNPVKMAQNR